MKNFNDLRQELNEKGVTSAVASKFELPKEPAKTNPIVAKPSASTGGPNLPKQSTVSTGYSSGGPIMKRPATSTSPYKVPDQSPGIKDVGGSSTVPNSSPKPQSKPSSGNVGYILGGITGYQLGKNADKKDPGGFTKAVLSGLTMGGSTGSPHSAVAGAIAGGVGYLGGRAFARDGNDPRIKKWSDYDKKSSGYTGKWEDKKSSGYTGKFDYNNPEITKLPKVGASAADKLNIALRGDEPTITPKKVIGPLNPNQMKDSKSNNGGSLTPKQVQDAGKPPKREVPPAVKRAEEITTANKPTNPVYAAKRQALDKVYDPNLDTKAQVGVTAKATTDKGVTSFYNLQRGKPSEPQNFTKVGTVANPNLQNQIQNVAKSEFPTGAIGKQFPSTAKIPNLQTFKKLGEEIEPVIKFLNKKSSWNRSNRIEIIEDIKEDMISIFNTLTESKYTNEVLERELNTLKTKYSLTEDQLEYLISRFLDEGLLGGIAKWIGLPALGFLAATYGKDIINNVKTSHGSEKPTEISQPVSQKELTPVKKPDTLSSKLKQVSDVSKSATSAADQTTDLMKKASEKLDRMGKR